jgi:hypothetical protein
MDRKRQREQSPSKSDDASMAAGPAVAPSSPAGQRASSLPPFSDENGPEEAFVDEEIIENYLDDEDDDDEGEDLFGDNVGQ